MRICNVVLDRNANYEVGFENELRMFIDRFDERLHWELHSRNKLEIDSEAEGNYYVQHSLL